MNQVGKTGASQPLTKKADIQGGEKKPAKSFRETLLEKKPDPQLPMPAFQPAPIQTEEVAPTVATTNLDAVSTVQALVNELVDRVETAAPGEVRIEFQSTVLDGVAVTAQRNGTELEIRFEASTPETAKLLAGNSPVLAERLERRGYNARIAVARKQLRQARQQEEPQR